MRRRTLYHIAGSFRKSETARGIEGGLVVLCGWEAELLPLPLRGLSDFEVLAMFAIAGCAR